MNFRFRLERLFRFREQLERQRAQELARAVRDEQQRKEALERASRHLEKLSGQIEDANGVATAGALRNLGLTVRAAASHVEAAATSHREAERVVQSEQDQFGATRRDRRVLGRLRESREDDFRRDQTRAEQAALDEHAARRPKREAA
jgi:flagellar export protein FliJ